MCFASCWEIAKLCFELLCQIFLPIGFIWIVVSLWEVTHSDRATQGTLGCMAIQF